MERTTSEHLDRGEQIFREAAGLEGDEYLQKVKQAAASLALATESPDPTVSAPAHAMLGRCFLILQDPARARKHTEAALTFDEHNFAARITKMILDQDQFVDRSLGSRWLPNWLNMIIFMSNQAVGPTELRSDVEALSRSYAVYLERNRALESWIDVCEMMLDIADGMSSDMVGKKVGKSTIRKLYDAAAATPWNELDIGSHREKVLDLQARSQGSRHLL
jgi:hypothetical protein